MVKKHNKKPLFAHEAAEEGHRAGAGGQGRPPFLETDLVVLAQVLWALGPCVTGCLLLVLFNLGGQLGGLVFSPCQLGAWVQDALPRNQAVEA